MKHRPRLRDVIMILVTALLVAAAPAAARAIVDFARDAGHVDGFRAVASKATLQRRSGKLVATNRHGYLPSDIVRRAENSRRLGSVPPYAYQRSCSPGTIGG